MDILTPEPTSVYRYYDKNGLLLYVGITSRGASRNREHNASKDWWQFVNHQKVRHFPDRKAALACERELIQHYRPPFNRQHNPDHEAMRELYFAQGHVAQKVAPTEYQVTKAARRLLCITEHRLPLTVLDRFDGGATYSAGKRLAPLAEASAWRPGVVFRTADTKGCLSRITMEGTKRVFTFTSKSKGRMPNQIVLKLRSEQQPFSIYIFEAVAA